MANPVLSAILSFIIPGLGQAINGKVIKGIVLFILAGIMVAIASLVFKHWFSYIINFIIAIYAAHDAYKIAK